MSHETSGRFSAILPIIYSVLMHMSTGKNRCPVSLRDWLSWKKSNVT
jgi:hypothetical protein